MKKDYLMPTLMIQEFFLENSILGPNSEENESGNDGGLGAPARLYI